MATRSEKSATIEQVSATRDELKEAMRKSKMGEKLDSEEKKVAESFKETYHLMTEEELCKNLATDTERGVSPDKIEDLQKTHGKNILTPPPTTPLWCLFLQHLSGFFSLLLWAAGILCFVAYGVDSTQTANPSMDNLVLGIVLVVVVILTGIFSFYQDYQAVNTMAGFKNFLPPQSVVVRGGGNPLEVPSEDLVPGDLVKIKSGDKIPADIRIIRFANFKVDNSSLTGESEAQSRSASNSHEQLVEATNVAFYGTNCVAGSADGIVFAIGDHTFIGKIATLTSTTGTVKTPIAIEIEHFIHIISAVAIFLGVTFFIIGTTKYTAVTNLVFCIGIIVANVPEGLLATVTVSLTLTAKKMAAKKVLVKNLEAVETLGSTTVIASDKTGTLTCNRMTAEHCYYDGKIKLASGTSADASFEPNNASFQKLQMIATLCNNATFDAAPENMKLDPLQRRTNGDASESALIKFVEPIKGIEEYRKEFPRVHLVPFSSANKYMVSIHSETAIPFACHTMLMKGAPERIFDRCDFVLINGEKIPIDAEQKAHFEEQQNTLMFNGERVLGFCMKELDGDFKGNFAYEDEPKPNYPTEKGEGLVFVGLISLMDPPRPAVPTAVLNCKSAGIKVVMVTGDHPETAEAISKQVNIITGKTRRDIAKQEKVDVSTISEEDPRVDAIVITGAMLENLTDERLKYFLDYEQIVFARTSPAQKLQIVKALQEKTHITRNKDVPVRVRHVVAVTGDGVNDSPALKKADIGVAMGIAGSDVAKDAADMILLNDNFASIVHGVEEGRLIFDNLKKSIAYTLSSNIPEISPFLVFILINIPLPLPTILILCIDLGTDMVPAISLAYEEKESNIMKKPPRDMNVDRLVTAKLVCFAYLQIGVIQACAGFFAYVVVLNDYGFSPEILPGRGGWFTYNENGDYRCKVEASGDTYSLVYTGEEGASYQGGASTPVEIKACTVEGPACHNPDEALKHAQTAFFICIIVVQWADLLICKTRSLSIYHQGMSNCIMNFGIVFETLLGCCFCYIPALQVLGTRPLAFVHWTPGVPFMVFIFVYDEIRKYVLRQSPKDEFGRFKELNWVYRNTYY